MRVELCEERLAVDAESGILNWFVTNDDEGLIYEYNLCNKQESVE